MKKLLLIIAILLLSGCKHDTNRPNELRFNSVNNLPVVTVKLNGKYGRLLVDTGASQSTLDMTVADKYGFKTYNINEGVSGIGGTVEMYGVTNTNIIHNDSILNIRFKSADLSGVRKAIGVIGVIGSDWMNDYDIKIDYQTNRLLLQ